MSHFFLDLLCLRIVNLSKNVITNQGHVCLIYVTPSSQETHCDVTVNKELN
jgi:hypothetical protein